MSPEVITKPPTRPTTFSAFRSNYKAPLTLAVVQDVELIGLEIFTAGLHTDSAGYSQEWTLDHLSELVETYNPDIFRAPLIVSHDVEGHFANPEAHGDDAEMHQALLIKNLAFGFPKLLKLEGSSLIAYFEKISDQVVDWVRNGQITGISCSIYFEEAPSNPYPGKLALRHIALLGVDAPAVKGMALELSEGNAPAGTTQLNSEKFEKAVAPAEGVRSYYAWLPSAATAHGLIAAVAQLTDMISRLRDRMVEAEGVEAADAVLPREALAEATASLPEPYSDDEVMVPTGEDLFQLEERLMQALSDIYQRLRELEPADALSIYQKGSMAIPTVPGTTPATPTPDAPPAAPAPQPDVAPTPEAPPTPAPETAPLPAVAAESAPAPALAQPTPEPTVTQPATPAPTPVAAALEATLEQATQGISRVELDAALAQIAVLRQETASLTEARTSLVAELSEQRTVARHADWRATIKELGLPAAFVNGHITSTLPGITEHNQGEPFTLAQFAASLGKEQGVWFRQHLEGLGVAYKALHQELTPESAPTSSNAEPDSAQLASLAATYQAEQRHLGIEVGYTAALDYVMRQKGLE